MVIYSPIGLTLALRRQRLRTVFLSGRALGTRLGVGVLLALGSVLLFLALRGEVARFPSVLRGAADPARLADFVPVFLEGVALAASWYLNGRGSS